MRADEYSDILCQSVDNIVTQKMKEIKVPIVKSLPIYEIKDGRYYVKEDLVVFEVFFIGPILTEAAVGVYVDVLIPEGDYSKKKYLLKLSKSENCNSISIDNIQCNSISSDNIQGNSISIDNIQGNSISIDNIQGGVITKFNWTADKTPSKNWVINGWKNGSLEPEQTENDYLDIYPDYTHNKDLHFRFSSSCTNTNTRNQDGTGKYIYEIMPGQSKFYVKGAGVDLGTDSQRWDNAHIEKIQTNSVTIYGSTTRDSEIGSGNILMISSAVQSCSIYPDTNGRVLGHENRYWSNIHVKNIYLHDRDNSGVNYVMRLQNIKASDGVLHFCPGSDGTYNLGGSGHRWKIGYIKQLKYNNSTLGSADFAEYFELSNLQDIDYTGRFVTFDQGKKIRLATQNDKYILGLVSAAPAIICNSAWGDWQGKYQKDVFGRILKENIVDEEGNEIERELISPDYDDTMEYIPRENRDEWLPVGMVGQIVAVDDGSCEVGGFCYPGEAGVATAAPQGYYVMERKDENHILVLMR